MNAEVLSNKAVQIDDDAHVEDGGGQAITFDLRHIVAVVRGNLVLIGAIIALCLVAGVVLTLLDTPKYTAMSSIQINQESDRVLEDEEVQPAASYQDADRFLQTQLDVLRSRALTIRVAQSLKLFGDARFLAAMEETAAGGTAKDAREQTIKLLRDHLSVNMPRQSRVVQIGFTSTSPDMSARIANAYAAEFIRSNLQRKYDSSNYARSFLSEQLAEAKARLEESEQAVNDYARNAGIVRTDAIASSSPQSGTPQPAAGGSVTVANLVQLNAAYNSARLARIAAEERWQTVSRGELMSSREVLANPAVQDLLGQRATAVTELRQERARHLPEHPSVLQREAQVAELDKQVRDVAQSLRASVRADYQAALAQEKSTEQQVTRAKGETLAEQDRSVQYNILAREADTNRTMYDGLLQRYKELTAAAGISASNVSIIDNADAPLEPSSPNLPYNMAMALLAGLIVAALTVFVKEQLDDAVRVPEEVENKIGLPLLGVIPAVADSDVMTEVGIPRSSVSEAYNALRGALLYSTPEGMPPTLLVTSSQASEGKSTTSTAIARGFARLGKRTLIVDTDLRRPSLHRTFDVLNDEGLTDLLATQKTWSDVIKPTEFENLSLILSGPIPPSPTELLASARMERLVRELSEAFDVVILDSPPVLGLADAPLLTTLVEGTVFVLEAGRGRRGATKAAIRRLRAARGTLLGAVLTKFDARKARNAYTYYYNYEYYQYGAERSPPPPKA